MSIEKMLKENLYSLQRLTTSSIPQTVLILQINSGYYTNLGEALLDKYLD